MCLFASSSSSGRLFGPRFGDLGGGLLFGRGLCAGVGAKWGDLPGDEEADGKEEGDPHQDGHHGVRVQRWLGRGGHGVHAREGKGRNHQAETPLWGICRRPLMLDILLRESKASATTSK